jgi:general secretion pathway protein B
MTGTVTVPQAFPAQPGTPPPPPPHVAVVVPQPPVAGLPAEAPKLSVSGGVYSTNPAQRMLIVNGQVFNEGSEVAPGVVLDEIKSKTAVLRFRGARYTVTF